MANDDDGLEVLEGIAQRVKMKFAKHATIEVGPSPDDMWAFRVMIHPFRNEKECRIGVATMKKYLNTMGVSFPEDTR